MFVTERFELNGSSKSVIQNFNVKFGFGIFSEVVFYRTFSRMKKTGGMENFNDVVLRVIEGCLSIRKDWYVKNKLNWDDVFWQEMAERMAISMLKMHYLPGGRGLWLMGTDFVYEEGSMGLNNCGFTEFGREFYDDMYWMMDALMLGVGVGFSPNCEIHAGYSYKLKPHKSIVIPDSREGWANSVRELVKSELGLLDHVVLFDYSLIREAGHPIRRFGGISSGPEPLIKLHDNIRTVMDSWRKGKISTFRMKADLGNLIGICVIAGNVRRSAELMLGSVQNDEFLDIKNYDRYPERAEWGYMSNNAAAFEDADDYKLIEEIADRVLTSGDPGIANIRNFIYGRLKDKIKSFDNARGLNPCGEITLENKELCNVGDLYPTCTDKIEEFYAACEYLSIYLTTVSLLPTQHASTNKIIAKNRRIGAGIVDFTGWNTALKIPEITYHLRNSYSAIVRHSNYYAEEAGVPHPIKYTTVKPGGTGPKLPGKTPGIGYPTFEYTLRRIAVAKNHPIAALLIDANIPYEIKNYEPDTYLFQFPIRQGPAKPGTEASLWEQAMNVMLFQNEFADNSVSNTLYFKPKWALSKIIKLGNTPEYQIGTLLSESYGVPLPCVYEVNRRLFTKYEGECKIKYESPHGDQELKIELTEENEARIYRYNPNHEEDVLCNVIGHIMSHIKAVSFLPHTPNGVYEQMPEEGISKQQYEILVAELPPSIDWSKLQPFVGSGEFACTAERCERI